VAELLVSRIAASMLKGIKGGKHARTQASKHTYTYNNPQPHTLRDGGPSGKQRRVEQVNSFPKRKWLPFPPLLAHCILCYAPCFPAPLYAAATFT
jgi:hypothetical protein